MGLLEYPQYTRPAEYRGMQVPQVLLNGVHADIEAWRRREALEITHQRRPEMLKSAPLTEADRETLKQLIRAEEIIAELAALDIHAERMEMFEEAAYAKAWIDHFVPEEKKKSARKSCISTKKHVGFLYQAFEKGYIAAAEKIPTYSGGAVLYYNEENLAFHIDACERLEKLPRRTVLTAEDWSWTLAAGRNSLYAAE